MMPTLMPADHKTCMVKSFSFRIDHLHISTFSISYRGKNSFSKYLVQPNCWVLFKKQSVHNICNDKILIRYQISTHSWQSDFKISLHFCCSSSAFTGNNQSKLIQMYVRKAEIRLENEQLFELGNSNYPHLSWTGTWLFQLYQNPLTASSFGYKFLQLSY